MGKTTVASSVCRALVSRGIAVQPFKVGPDFVDPTYLTMAARRRCRNLDGFPAPSLIPFFYANGCAAGDNLPKAEIAVIEGVMGLYDGLGPEGLYSTAWIARLLDLPVILLIDAKAAATSAAATVKGFASLAPLAPRVVGVIANRVANERHVKTIESAIERFAGLPLVGWLRDVKESSFPSRHLGLIPAQERGGSEGTLDCFVREVVSGVDLDRLVALAEVPRCEFREPDVGGSIKKKDGSPVCMAVASDDAFCFRYHENWELFEKLGARMVRTSPLRDRSIPEGTDILILPGGYPEEFAETLSMNGEYLESVRRFSKKGLIYAECGGMMYLARGIEYRGERREMAGVIDADARMTGKLGHFGYVEGAALKDSVILMEGEFVRAHEFHYSAMYGRSPEAFKVRKADGSGVEWVDGYISNGNVLATYLHLNFYSSPRSARRLMSLAASCA
jgi:cobyrinic acid a,c-diamide synthase